MKAAAKYVMVVGMGAWVALFAGSSAALAQLSGGSVSSWAGQVSPNPVASGEPATSTLGAEVLGSPGAPPYCTVNPPTWSWSVDGGTAGVEINQPDPSSPTATLTATFMSPGTYTVSASVTATWTDSCGDQTSAPPVSTGPFTITVVGINNLQYLQSNGYTSTFVDVPGLLYVLVGSTVTFQAVPTPVGFSFPDGWPVWSGTSGASGTGSTCGVTFSTLSSSLSDYKTVIATCGNSSATANVIVYDLIPTLTPQDNFAGRDLDNYGVCEYIDLNFQTTPSGITASQIGGLQWQQISGSGTLKDNGDGTGVYQCSDGTDTITLALLITGGPCFRSAEGCSSEGCSAT